MSDPSTVTVVVQVWTASISLAGALYVGYRNRRMTREMAEWQSELADAVLSEQLCLTLASRSRYVGERAGETARTLTMWAEVEPGAREQQIGKRLASLDGAFDAFLEGWSDVVGRELATEAMGKTVNRLADELEVLRLGLLVDPDETNRHVESLAATARLARECQAECLAVARRSGWTS